MDLRLARLGRKLLPRSVADVFGKWLNLPRRVAALESAQSLLAVDALQRTYGAEHDAPGIDSHEIKVHSQNGEDGILLYIFSKVGTTNRLSIEFGFGDGTECNSLNLLLNWGWRGLLIDADPANVARARRLFGLHLVPNRADVDVVNAFLTQDNLNTLLLEHSIHRDPDLMSIDIDSYDYWIWRALEALRPRVLVIEYNATFGPERSITIPHDAECSYYKKHPSRLYYGASIQALAKLGHEKGYILVGCESHGVNAFFVRRDVAADELREVPPEAAYRPLSHKYTDMGYEEQFALVSHLPFVDV